jgi:hypothetical protein
MKRLLFLLIGALCCFSCSEDEKPASDFINGTKWKCTYSVNYYNTDNNNELMYTTQERIWLSFTNSTFTYADTADLTYYSGASPIPKEPYTVSGTYTFEYPVTTLVSDDSRVPKKITIGPYQIETIPEGGGKSLIFVKVRE